MQVEWYGQSAFRLTGAGKTVVIDPFGDLVGPMGRRDQVRLPADQRRERRISCLSPTSTSTTTEPRRWAEILPILRSTAGRLESPIGEVLAIASEHDQAAGTERGPNTIFVFELDGVRVVALRRLRSARRCATSRPPRSAQSTCCSCRSAADLRSEPSRHATIVERLAPRWVVPMHYRTPKIDFLETADAFIEAGGDVQRVASTFDTRELPGEGGPLVVVPAVP